MKSRGFTLVEVMVSGAILAIGISGIITGLMATNTTSVHQKHMTQAIHIAETTMELLLVKSKTSPDLDEGKTPGPYYDEFALQSSVAPAVVPSPPIAREFGTHWQVFRDDPLPKMLRIIVTVTWQEKLGPKSISFTTIR